MLEEIKGMPPGIHFEKIMSSGVELICIVILDAAPINTLGTAGLLHLLLVAKNTEVVIIQSIFNEIISKTPEFKEFVETNLDRITIVKTSVCIDDEAKLMRGESLGKNRGGLAIADFLLNFIDEALPGVVGDSLVLIICEECEVVRLQAAANTDFGFTEKTHFITLAAYLQKLEHDGLINSFDAAWGRIKDADDDALTAADKKRNEIGGDKWSGWVPQKQ
ncbi:hypothetical protein [Methylobacter svalbardensis]|uniref:hypothetical protein n=1 Tax=Methylobacter svalbardensis TaxID=3080016 RepID=UPI0030EC1004